MAKLRIVLTDAPKDLICDAITGLDNVYFRPVLAGRFLEKVLLADIIYVIPMDKEKKKDAVPGPGGATATKDASSKGGDDK